MKAVLMSIHPKWCEKIANGKKTIEVRKTRPKLETPFKVYIYCTKPSKKYQTICGCMVINTDELYRLPNGKIKHDWSGELMCCNGEYTKDNFLNGKVIGEFVCDRIDDFSEWQFDYASLLRHINLFAGTNGNYKFLDDYLKGEKKGYGWNISQLKIYDKPKELSEFHTICDKIMSCSCCEYHIYESNESGTTEFCGCYGKKPITRPPQSWCYVEAL